MRFPVDIMLKYSENCEMLQPSGLEVPEHTTFNARLTVQGSYSLCQSIQKSMLWISAYLI
jgi:hypothetical protein